MSAKAAARTPSVPPWRRWLVAPVVVLVLGWFVALMPSLLVPGRTEAGEPVLEFLATLLAVLVLAPLVVVLGAVTTLVARRAAHGGGRTALRILGSLTWIAAVAPPLVLGAWFIQVGWGLAGLVVYAALWMFVLVRVLRFAAGYVPER